MAVVQLEGRECPAGHGCPETPSGAWPISKPDGGRRTLDAALKMDPKLREAQAARRAFRISPNQGSDMGRWKDGLLDNQE
jgi:hypothetical protein